MRRVNYGFSGLFLMFTLLLLITPMLTGAQATPSTCPAIVESALQSVSRVCTETGRNEICYGNFSLSADLRDPTLTFESPGDLLPVTGMNTLTLGQMDESAGHWGVALMQLQTNLPGTLPGQNVSFLMFGDVLVEPAVRGNILQATATANARIRREPVASGDTNVIGVAPSGTILEANGRNTAGDWLRVLFIDENSRRVIGWTSTQVLSGVADRMNLDIVEPSDPVYTPMQAFYFRSGIGNAPCAEAPQNGMLVQTPQGVTSVSFTINGVQIELASTAFIQSGDELQIALVEGTAFVTAQGVTRIVPAGTLVRVELDAEGRAPVAPPSELEPYDPSLIAVLPLDNSIAPVLPQSVQPAEPLDEDTIAEAIEDSRQALVPKPGIYRMTLVEVLTVEDTLQPQQGVAACTLNALPGFSINWAVDTDGAVVTITTDSPIAPGVFGSTPEEHSSTLAPDTTSQINKIASTITFTSPTSFQRRYSWRTNWVGGGTGEQYYSACIQNWVGVWIDG